MTNERIYKRFMVFASNNYESQHGIGDLFAEFDELNEAKLYYQEIMEAYDNVDVFDRIEGKIIFESR